MKRLHVHIAVTPTFRNPSASTRRCSRPSPPWSNQTTLAISTRGREPGLDHLGIQVENGDELNEVYARLREAGGNIVEHGETACCYAKSEKTWTDDPAGIAWETFLTTSESITYGDGTGENQARIAHEKQKGACCAPQAAKASACC
jgi:hypothetical protein